MILSIAGINHNDLTGRRRLLTWLLKKRDLQEALPLFVGVEYDETIFDMIRAQRPLLRDLAAEVWPHSSASVLTDIEKSLGYEGDLHTDVFPEVETLWLDSGRKIKDPTVISQYAFDRLTIYKSFVRSEKNVLSSDDLRAMGKNAWEGSPVPQPGGTDRDKKFANTILDKLRGESVGWAIVIVGSHHACDIEGSMVSRLRGEAIDCQVNELSPDL